MDSETTKKKEPTTMEEFISLTCGIATCGLSLFFTKHIDVSEKTGK